MKTFIQLIALLIAQPVVVGAPIATPAKLPDRLAIGTNFPRTNIWMLTSVFMDNGDKQPTVYDQAGKYPGGDFGQFLTNELVRLADGFVPTPGTENRGFYIYSSVYIDGYFQKAANGFPYPYKCDPGHTGEPENIPLGNIMIPFGFVFLGSPGFKLVKTNGVWRIPPERLALIQEERGIRYNCYGGISGIGYLIGGGVKLVAASTPLGSFESPYGWYGPFPCSDNVPGLMGFHSKVIPADIEAGDGTATWPDWGGTVTFYLDTEKTIFATYDLLNGEKIAESPPIKVDVKMILAEPPARAGVVVKGSALAPAMKVTVSGPPGKVVSVEYTSDPNAGEWSTLGTIINSSGSDEFIDYVVGGFYSPVRFYRARIDILP